MEAEKLSQLCTLDDATYGVHPYLNIYTGGGMPFDWGLVHYDPTKKKLNSKSSTEAEVVGVSNYFTYNICICIFMAPPGYDT